MAARDLRALVSWTVDDPPRGVRLATLVTTVASAVATVASLGTTTGAPGTPAWTLPADPDGYVDLGRLRVRGDAPWLPSGPSSRRRLRATQRALLVVDTTGRRPPTPVPLAALRVVRARPRRPGRPARHPAAVWTLTLTGAGTVDLEGTWLSLAWIGQLAGWPEPVAG